MQGCWANSLGDCGGSISREHYVSECVFPSQSIFVRGLDFRFYLNLERTTQKYDRIEDSAVFYRKAHFIDPIETVRAEPVGSVESLMRAERAKRLFRQKLSIDWSKSPIGK